MTFQASPRLDHRRQVMIGLLAGLSSVAIWLLWTFWGRAPLLAMALVGAIAGLSVLRFPVIGTTLIGFVLLSNLAAYVPGSTSLLFGAMLLVVIVRKLLEFDTHWTTTPFLAAAIVFAVWFQASLLWADSHLFHNFHLFYRVLLAIIVLHELINKESDLIAFYVGSAFGMIFTAVITIKTAYEFYTSGVADQIATTVTEIESSRFFGHWVDPNIMSITLVAFLGGTIALWRSALPRSVRSLMMIASIMALVAIAVSLSRAGMIGAIIVILLMLAVEKHRVQLFIVLGGIIALLLSVVPIDIVGRLASLMSGDASTSERASLLLAGWKLFPESPIWGLGMGSFEHRVTYILPHLSAGVFSHNTFVDVAVDSGVIGLGLYLTCWWYAARSLSWQDWSTERHNLSRVLNSGMRASFVAGFFCVMTITSTTYVPYWTFLAVVALFGCMQMPKLSETGAVGLTSGSLRTSLSQS